MRKRSKRYKAIEKDKTIEKKKDLKEIFELVKKNSTCKFDESVDVSLRLNLKQSKGGDFNLRTTVNLPNGSGKKVKIAVLCGPDKVEEAKKSGADIAGSDELLDQICFKNDTKYIFDNASYKSSLSLNSLGGFTIKHSSVMSANNCCNSLATFKPASSLSGKITTLRFVKGDQSCLLMALTPPCQQQVSALSCTIASQPIDAFSPSLITT